MALNCFVKSLNSSSQAWKTYMDYIQDFLPIFDVFFFSPLLTILNLFPYLSINTVWSSPNFLSSHSPNFLSSGEEAKHCKKLDEVSIKYVLWKTSSCSRSSEFLCQHYVTTTSDIPRNIPETMELPFLWTPFITFFVHILLHNFRHLCSDTLRIGVFHCVLVGSKDTHIYLIYPSRAVLNITDSKLCSQDKYVSPFSYQRILF